MDADNEVVAYLETLIDHYQDCAHDHCAECDIVKGICEFVRQRIFNSAVQVQAAAPRAVGLSGSVIA